ncbi:unnamed protein product, partial [Ectocarpus sp. 6 AP-2014]
MSKRITQQRNRHIVAVIALLISSVEGFVPQARQTHRYDSSNAATCSGTTAIAAAAWSSVQQQTSRHPMRQRGPWDGVGTRRRSGVLCQYRWGFGLGGGEGPAADQRARILFPPAGGPAAGSAAARPGSFSSRSYRRGSNSLSMALHFPRPPRLPKPPPPGDKAPLAGGGKSGSAGSSSSSSHHESQKQQQTATTPGGLLPQPAAGKSGRGTVASEGVAGVSDLDAIEGKDSAGPANDTRTDLNGSKTIRRRGINGSSTPSSRAGTPGTSRPPKRRVGVTPATSGSSAEGKKRKLRRPRSGPGSVSGGWGGGVQAVVAKGDMELAEMSEMMSLVLERLNETERELKRIQKEGSLAKTNRSEVRDRKFIIDTRAKMLGAAFAGSVAGMIVGWSVLPNLWLVGGVTGALAFAAFSRSSTGTVGTICSTCGIQVPLNSYDVRDWWNRTRFLYKTG